MPAAASWASAAVGASATSAASVHAGGIFMPHLLRDDRPSPARGAEIELREPVDDQRERVGRGPLVAGGEDETAVGKGLHPGHRRDLEQDPRASLDEVGTGDRVDLDE